MRLLRMCHIHWQGAVGVMVVLAGLSVTPAGCNAMPGENHRAAVVSDAAGSNFASLTLNQKFDAFFRQVVTSAGLVDYPQARLHKAMLEQIIGQLGQPQIFEDANTQTAFYINSYNTLVIGQVIEHGVKHGPINSVTDIPGFFDQLQHTIAGKRYTLNSFEKTVIIPHAGARMHGVLVCAAKGCPPLHNRAYQAAKLDQQIANNINRWMQDPTKNAVEKGQLKISKLFQWYAKDFQLSPYHGVRDFLKKHTEPTSDIGQLLQKHPQAKIDYLPYDWALNQGQHKAN